MSAYLGDNTTGGTLAVTKSELLCDIPDCDHQEWTTTVSREERARIRELFRAFREMLAARNLKAGAISAALKRRHLGWGWSAKSLRQLFWAYRDGGYKPGDTRRLGATYRPGDWRILLREYKGRESKLPPEFIRWLTEQWTTFRGRQDCVLALHRHIVQEVWLRGDPVPGYGTIDDWCRRAGRARPNPVLIRKSELPEGWSADTFRRYLPKRKADRAQVAHGYLAAHAYQPDQVLTDRSPLLPLQFIYLDDSRPDFRCTWFGNGRGEIVYPLLVLGLDAASGVDVANVAKPRGLKSPEAEDALERKARHGVTQDMAVLVVLNTLRRWGLPPWPITFVHEHAAACIPSDVKHMLEEAYGDRIRFEATGIFKQRMMEYGFTDSGGAPYDKAPIEAFWRVLMTQLARLPGSTGPRHDTAPSDLQDVEKYTLGLLKQAGDAQDIIARLQVPLLEFSDAHTAIEDALRLLRFRTKHNLQGFDQVREWRPALDQGYQPWEKFLALPEAEQNAVATNDDKDAIITRLETPAERFVRLLGGVELTPVDEDLLTWIEGPRFPVTVRNGKVTVTRKEVANEALIFRETDHPLLDVEYEGAHFEAALTRDCSRIVLTSEGRVLGSVAQQGRVSRAEPDAVRREQGRIAHARRVDRERFAGYALGDTNDRLAVMRAHNAAVLADAPRIQAPRARLTSNPAAPDAATKRNNRRRSAQMAARVEQQLSETP